MSNEQFSQFMQAQIEAIEASGLDAEVWIELHAEAFRNNWSN